MRFGSLALVALLLAGLGTSAGAAIIPLADPAIIDHGGEHSSSWAAEMAIDVLPDTGEPNFSTAYIAGKGNGLPWIAFDFGEATQITGFDHYQRDYSEKMVRTFDLLFSNSVDFSSLVGSVTDIAANDGALALTEVRDFDVTARYVKWEVTDASDYTGASDLEFYTIPEPATMALLGLGGLGVLMRRRRP